MRDFSSVYIASLPPRSRSIVAPVSAACVPRIAKSNALHRDI